MRSFPAPSTLNCHLDFSNKRKLIHPLHAPYFSYIYSYFPGLIKLVCGWIIVGSARLEVERMVKGVQSQKGKLIPSARGGPSVARGLNYQINWAIFNALELVVKYFAAPHQAWGLSLEPRKIHPSETITRWDIQTDPNTVVWEAKVEVTKSDIEEWLHRIRDAKTTENIRFGLIYGNTQTSIIREINRLKNIAIECGTDQTKFETLSKEVKNAAWITSSVGPLALHNLQRMQIEQLPEELLQRNLKWRAQHLAGASAELLINDWFHKFSNESVRRITYQICDLIKYSESKNIPLASPGEIALSELPSLARQAVIALKACQHGIPTKVLSDSLNVTLNELSESLAPLIAKNIIVNQNEIWHLAGWSHAISDNSPEVITSCFDHLLDWLERHETAQIAIDQLYNIMAIAHESLHRRPGLALKFFQFTEHIIKNLGDKHRLLEVSEMCVEASKHPSTQDQDLRAKAKAQAYMCGHSWVYQRTDRMKEARLFADKSLKLGEDIGWDRNTAFAKKCIGRMQRLEAERSESVAEKERLLNESGKYLSEAIAIFKASPEFGPTNRQVGDCYSLLGRTQLLAGNLRAVTESIRAAYDILPESQTKEYLDLLILSGDFEVKKQHREDAEKFYNSVVESKAHSNREISEIQARAYFQRGRNRANQGEKFKKAAESDLEQAISIWQSLDEYAQASEAQWILMKLKRVVDEKTMQMFDKGNSKLVAVNALQNYLDGLSEMKALAHRKQPTDSQIDQMLKEAKKKVAQEYPEW
jgi:tetratricopeptide (TPR) repeat protein